MRALASAISDPAGATRRGACLCAAALTILAGCAGTTTPTQLVATEPGAGATWAAALPHGDTPAESRTRNDGALNPRTVEPVLASTRWPEPDRPSLRRPVLVRILTRPESFYHYRRVEERIDYRRRY